MIQKWDYMVVRSYGGVVMTIDGQEVAKIVSGQPVGQMLYEFLDGVGQDGWDIAGLAGVREGMEIILKRPLLDFESESETEAEPGISQVAAE